MSTPGCTNQNLAKIVGNFAGSQIEVVSVKEEDAKKDKALNAKNPGLKFPYLETQSGDIITELSAIASHLARMNPGSGLLGSTPFQEAQVNSWINWAQCL